MSVEDFMKLSEEEKLVYLSTKDTGTDIKLCVIGDSSCESCQ